MNNKLRVIQAQQQATSVYVQVAHNNAGHEFFNTIVEAIPYMGQPGKGKAYHACIDYVHKLDLTVAKRSELLALIATAFNTDSRPTVAENLLDKFVGEDMGIQAASPGEGLNSREGEFERIILSSSK